MNNMRFATIAFLLYFNLFIDRILSHALTGRQGDQPEESKHSVLDHSSVTDKNSILINAAEEGSGEETLSSFRSGILTTRHLQFYSTIWNVEYPEVFGATAGDWFGRRVAFGGSRFAIGSAVAASPVTGESQMGIVRVFELDGSNSLSQVGADFIGQAGSDRQVGSDVCMSKDGNRLGMIWYNGGNSKAAIYKLVNGNWEIIGEPVDGSSGYTNDQRLNGSLSMSGNGSRFVVGSAWANKLLIFEESNSQWTLIGEIYGNQAEDNLGQQRFIMSEDGKHIVFGVDGNPKRVRVYRENNLSQWEQIGSDINGQNEEYNFGIDLDITTGGNRIAIGSWYQVRRTVVYDLSATEEWVQVGSDLLGGDGESVSFSQNGERLVVGTGYGVNIFDEKNGAFTQVGKIYESGMFGDSVCVSDDGTKIVVGSPSWESKKGKVQVYIGKDNTSSPTWSPTPVPTFTLTQAPTPVPTLAPTNVPTPAPTLTPVENIGSASGDPHFRTFDNQFFSYHGQCDLVLTRSIGFASGLGLHVHIRTTRVSNPHVDYSFISAASVMIGNDILEVSDAGKLVINGNSINVSYSSTSSVISFAGTYALKASVKGRQKRIVIYDLDFGDDGGIQIRANTKTGMINVDVSKAFQDSEGLLGAAPKGSTKVPLLGRDGVTDFNGYWNNYGEEWQVNDSDPKLFQDTDCFPQFPKGCIYEEAVLDGAKKSLRRRLMEDASRVSLEAATEACSHLKGQVKEFCVTDIMATGDLDLAEDPFYGYNL